MTALEPPPPGDAAGFAVWVGPHLSVMSHLAARLAPMTDRDDIVQDALVRAWRRRSTYNPDKGTPRAWLCAITADQARRALRRARPTLLVASATVMGVAPGTVKSTLSDARAKLRPLLEVTG